MPPEWDPPASPEEAEALSEIERRLRQDRPVPRPAFRGMLRQELVRERSPWMRPRRLRLLIASYAAAGLILLGVAAAGVFGVGPLDAGPHADRAHHTQSAGT